VQQASKSSNKQLTGVPTDCEEYKNNPSIKGSKEGLNQERLNTINKQYDLANKFEELISD
jgi:hypothetical protein